MAECSFVGQFWHVRCNISKGSSRIEAQLPTVVSQSLLPLHGLSSFPWLAAPGLHAASRNHFPNKLLVPQIFLRLCFRGRSKLTSMLERCLMEKIGGWHFHLKILVLFQLFSEEQTLIRIEGILIERSEEKS